MQPLFLVSASAAPTSTFCAWPALMASMAAATINVLILGSLSLSPHARRGLPGIGRLENASPVDLDQRAGVRAAKLRSVNDRARTDRAIRLDAGQLPGKAPG